MDEACPLNRPSLVPICRASTFVYPTGGVALAGGELVLRYHGTYQSVDEHCYS